MIKCPALHVYDAHRAARGKQFLVFLFHASECSNIQCEYNCKIAAKRKRCNRTPWQLTFCHPNLTL